MTHDTPGESGDDLRWCEECELAVDPVVTEERLVCPSCGGDLGSANR